MKAKTIAEVVAGEMTHGPYAMSDALGIASVIANRAKAYGVSPDSVISAPGQFNAYNRSLPKGVGAKQIAMAQRAIDMVAERGPMTPATHYARPEATKNIQGWKSFNQVDSIPGSHVFAIDPEMRPLPTAQGVMQAQPNAFQNLMTTAKENAIQVARTVAQVPQAAAAMAKRGYEAVTGQNQPEAPADVAGLYAGSLQFAHADQTEINPNLRSALLGASAERRQPLGITSGYRTPAYNAKIGGAKGSQHLHRNAADIDMGGMTVPERKQLVNDLRQRGVTRFGTYDKYPDMLHVDMGQPPAGQIAHFMHNESINNIDRAPSWMRDTATFVRENKAWPTPDAATAPTPTPAPRAPATSQEAAYTGMAATMGEAGVPHIGLSPAMAASMTPSDRQALSMTKPAASPMIAEPPTGLGEKTTGPVSPFGKPVSPNAAAPMLSPNERISQAFERQADVRSVAPSPDTAGSVLGRLPGGMEANIYGPGPSQLSPAGQAAAAVPAPAVPTTAPSPAPPSIASTPPPASAPAATPASAAAPPALTTDYNKAFELDRLDDPRAKAYASMPPGEVQPSLVETARAVQTAPAFEKPPTVVADVPAVRETVQVSPTTIAPAPTIAPSAPPPAQPGGLLGTIKDIAAATPYGRAIKGLSSLAGPTPNPQSYTYGTGAKAISDVLSGVGQDRPGATAYSKSTPGYSIKALGNGMVEKTNQYGAKSYEHVGTPGSGILSGQPQPGGWRGGFGLSGLHAPSWGGMAGGIGNTLGRMALSGIGGAVAGPIGAIAAPMIFGGMLNNAIGGMTASSGGGWGNTANVGPSAMGFAGPWGGGGTKTSTSGRTASSSGGGGWAGGGMGGRANSPGSSGWGGGGKKK